MAEDIIEIGKDLEDQKNRLGHGNFGLWITAEFEMSLSSAKRFMQATARFGKSPTVSHFTPKVIYELSSGTTPDEVVDRAEEKAAKGEKVTLKDVAEWKAEVQELREARDVALAKVKTTEETAQRNLMAALAEQEAV